jgi:hypothetical protein
MAGMQPGVWLSLLLGCVYGALAHLIWGRMWLQLPLFVLAGVVGCMLLWLSGFHAIQALPVLGGLPLLEATVVAWVLLGCVAVLGRA